MVNRVEFRFHCLPNNGENWYNMLENCTLPSPTHQWTQSTPDRRSIKPGKHNIGNITRVFPGLFTTQCDNWSISFTKTGSKQKLAYALDKSHPLEDKGGLTMVLLNILDQIIRQLDEYLVEGTPSRSKWKWRRTVVKIYRNLQKKSRKNRLRNCGEYMGKIVNLNNISRN